MKKSSAVKTISLIALPLLVFIFFYSFIIYPRVKFYEPVTIRIISHGKDITDIASPFAITPFNRNIPFYLKVQDNHRVQFLDYSFVKEIRVALPDSLLSREFELVMTIGPKVLAISNVDFRAYFKPLEEKGENQTTYTLASPAQQKSYFKTLFSILLWPVFSSFLKANALALIISLSIIIFGLYNRKAILFDFNNTQNYIALLFKFLLLCMFNVFAWLLYKEFSLLKNYGLRYIAGFDALLFYITLFLIIIILVRLILKGFSVKRKKIQNLYLFLLTLFLCISTADVLLRTLKYNANYYELNFGYYGPSPYDNSNTHAIFVYDSNTEIFYKKKEFSHCRKTNRLGLCDKDYNMRKNDSVFRVMAFGDSFTEGVGVTGDRTWVKQLENKLNTVDKKVEVINAGISGSDPFFGFYLLKNKLLPYKPDMVLLAVNPSDVIDIMVRGGFERFRADNSVVYNKAPWWEPIYAYSYLFRLIMNDGLGYDYNLMSKSENIKKKEQALTDLINVTRSFQKLAQQKGFLFYVIIHPDLTSVYKRMYINLESYMAELNTFKINYIDILPRFLEVTRNENLIGTLFWPIDKHYTEKGQALMADEIFRSVEKQIK